MSRADSRRGWPVACRAGRTQSNIIATDGRGQHAVHVDVEAGAGTDHLAELGRIGGQPFERLGDVIAALIEVVQHQVELAQCRTEFLAVVGDEARELLQTTPPIPQINVPARSRRSSSAANNWLPSSISC